MSTVYIGNAVGDEHGKASGGEPGDQTGKELRIQPWYQNKKGWRVFRPKSPEVAAMLVYDMTVACESPFIGYDQKQRNTLYQAAKSVGFDCAKVTAYCECDCSSLVRVCLAYAGIKTDNFNTASEPNVLLKTGEFEELTDKKYTDGSAYLMKGDVLCTKVKGHTAIVLNDGDKANEPEPVKDKMIKVKGSVRVREGNGKKFDPIPPTPSNCLLPYRGQAKEDPYWYETVWQGQYGFISSNPKYTEIVEAEI